MTGTVNVGALIDILKVAGKGSRLYARIILQGVIMAKRFQKEFKSSCMSNERYSHVCAGSDFKMWNGTDLIASILPITMIAFDLAFLHNEMNICPDGINSCKSYCRISPVPLDIDDRSVVEMLFRSP